MAKQKLQVAEAIALYLQKKGVAHIYGVPGVAILPLYDAIRELTDIRAFVVRHEQTGAFMADAYSRVTRKVGVCAATSGPGGTNMITGLYGAYMDSIPMIAFTGQVASHLVGTQSFQEVAITEIARPVTKGAYLINDAQTALEKFHEAWETATTGKMGPVLVDLCVDVQKTVVEVDLDELTSVSAELPQAADEDIAITIEMLREAKKPVLISGGGVNLADAHAELKELAETLQIPVVTSVMGIDTFPNDHPLFAGRMGTMLNTPLGNKTVLEADLVINLGGRFGDRSIGNFEEFKHNTKIVHVNLDKKQIGKYLETEHGVVADVKSFMRKLTDTVKALNQEVATANALEIKPLDLTEERHRLARKTDFDSVPIKPQRALRELREYLERDAFVSHDCGISQIWSCQLFEVYEPRTYLITGGAGTMGWGLGAAMAAKLAFPERQSVNIVGDGSLGMSLQDLATAAKYNIPIIVFVLNNSLYGLIRQQQNWWYDERRISTDLIYKNELCNNDERGIDFVKTAEGMGVRGELVTDWKDIKPALERGFSLNKPYLIEVVVDPEAVCGFSFNGRLSTVDYSIH
ncbi:thiamine pyrophosphate-binding protein [Brevibacillus sp. B_LB10_24]|uniref:thiamine pyrophosphate-binding protein n=1 Tax=Brevibacillus sp. B_LB10_24 TaxID=3380645 RepID=UPI0038BA033D